MSVNNQEEITCSILRQLAKNSGIEVKDTVRLYWGLYGYCLKLLIPEQWTEERHQETCEFWEKTKHKVWNECKPSIAQIQKKHKDRVNVSIDAFVDANGEAFGLDEYYVQITRHRVSYYLKSAQAAEILLRDNPGLFESVMAPASVEVEDRLGGFADTHMQVRKMLWYGQFDYKIDFKKERCFDALDDRVNLLFLTSSFYSVSPYSRTLYLAGEDEYFLVKLALWEKIGKVTACITNDEEVVHKSF